MDEEIIVFMFIEVDGKFVVAMFNSSVQSRVHVIVSRWLQKNNRQNENEKKNSSSSIQL